MSTKSWVILPLALATIVGLSGCDGDTTNTTHNVADGTVETKASASFAGRVIDVNGVGVSGASVSIFANQKYTVTTDANGNYLVEVALGDVVAAAGAGNNDGEEEDIDSAGDWIYRDFPMEISKSGFTSFRHVVDFEGKIGYTDGTGAVVLLSQVGYSLPRTVLHPYVDSFEFTVYAGDAPAAGAVVTLDGSGNASNYDYLTDWDTSSYSLTGYKTFTADANGVVTITTSDNLPANGWYGVFVAPYDTDGDGQYEYDATSSYSIFNLSARRDDTSSMIHADDTGALVQTENAPSVNLVDYNSDISVVYNSLQGHDTIPVAQAASFSITVMLNRPVTPELLAGWGGPLFSLKANNGNMPVPFSVTNVGNYLYTITPDITLDPTRNQYRFYVNEAISYPADWDNVDSTQYAGYNSWFVIYDPAATLSAAIVPGLDIEENSTYKVDYDRFLTGDMTVDNPLTVDTSQGSAYGDDLKLSFMADSTATGYQVWVKDDDSPWMNVEDSNGSLSYTYNDGQAIELRVNNVFSTGFAGGELVDHTNMTATSYFREALLNGNTLQVVVMPENVNGFATDPNTDTTIAGLSLADNWGPELMNSSQYNFDFTAWTEFNSGTYCDAQGVNIAVGEPLSNVSLTPEYTDPATEFGARATAGSACFTVAGVRFPDLDLVDPSADTPYPSNFSYIAVDLAPTVATDTTAAVTAGDVDVMVTSTAGFARGDSVKIVDVDEDITTVQGIIGSDTLVLSSVSSDAASGSAAYWRGPVDNGYSEVSGTLPGSMTSYDNYLSLADNTVVDVVTPSNTRVITGTVATGERVSFIGSSTYLGDYVWLISALTSPIAPGAAVTGYNVNQAGTCNTTLTAAAAAGATTLTVAATTGCDDGDALVIDYDDNGNGIEFATISGAPTATVITLAAGITNAAAVGETVDERVTWSTASRTGYPWVRLDTTTGIQQGSTITFTNAAGTETDSATVLSVVDGYVVTATIPVDSASTPFPFVTGDDWTVDSSRGADSLQVLVQDRSGNNSDNTDTDGDGNANFDQIGYEEVGGFWDVF